MSTTSTRSGGAERTGAVAESHRRGVVVRSGEGEARWWFDTLAVIKVAAADTDDQLAVIEIVDQPGDYPRIVSRRYDMLSLPAGLEQAVLSFSRPAESHTLPPSPGPAISWEELVAICTAHGLEAVG